MGCRYYQGTKSPNNAERADKGYSSAWLHHKGRNKHHLEYWIDYSAESGRMEGMRMPVNYVVEMFIDRVCASKNYQKENYTDRSPLEYFNQHGDGHYMIHEETQKLLERLLHMLAEEGEENVYRYIKTEILKNRKKDYRC